MSHMLCAHPDISQNMIPAVHHAGIWHDTVHRIGDWLLSISNTCHSGGTS